MRSIILVMKRKSMAQGLMLKMQAEPEVKLILQTDYALACGEIVSSAASAAVIEAAEDGQYNVEYCLVLCGLIRERAPECGLMLLCPESGAAGIEQAVSAKRSGAIDDFIFYDAGMEYMVAKLLSL